MAARYLLVVILITLLVSCGSNTSPSILPPRPTNTLAAPTATDTPATPTEVAQEPTSTPAPTLPPLATNTPGGPTPTRLLGETFTPAPPTIAPTQAADATNIGLEVVFFTSTSSLISPGDNVILDWQVVGADTITLHQIDAEGNRDRGRPVDAEGPLVVSTDPAILTAASFVLVAAAGQDIIEEFLAIPVNCQGTWFFTPPPDGCPSAEALASAQVEQRFERGAMIWLGSTREIFVLFADDTSPQWLRLTDSFEDGQPESDPNLVPPSSNLIQPVRGFGLVWRTNTSVQQRLGWAIESEVGYDGMYQSDTNDTIYMRNLSGGILELAADGSTWRVIPLN
ncbi:MAG: hypothetical protein H6673_02810 [Anaerolineales bacterium]|nr:hypothetical protein [Anaerolineales bacterium]